MNVLVDTSVWSLALRRKSSDLNEVELGCRAALEELITAGRVEILGVVRQELLSGIRERTQYERIRLQLRSFPDLALAVEDYEQAAAASNKCRAAGIAGNPIDFLICSAAARRKFAIFTRDADFPLYRRHFRFDLFEIS